MPVNRYGVREQTQSTNETDVHVERIRALGYTVINTGISETRLAVLRQALDRLFDQQAQDAGGVEELVRHGCAETVRAPPVFDEQFVEVAISRQSLVLS